MPVTEAWHDTEHTIMHVRIAGTWTWEAFTESMVRLTALYDTLDYTVTLILDFSRTDRVPPRPIMRLPQLVALKHPRQGPIYVVGVNTALGQIVVGVFDRVYHAVQVAPTLTVALRRIAAARDEKHG